MDQVNHSEMTEETADSRQGYSLIGLALLASCAAWFVVGFVVWRAFGPQ
jgi:hypothetical protein